MEKAIEVCCLLKEKNKQRILDNISFSVNKGEIVGFLGKNGAGKTTTMKCILGLYNYEGQINVLGKDRKVYGVGTNLHVSGLIEEPSFYANMTGVENLRINAMYYKDIGDTEINEVIDKLQMNKFVYKKVKTYSLGMRQRLGLAIALINNPEIILLDEPMNGLDPSGVMQLRNLLKEMAQKEGKAILVSSHILAEMQQLCDRVIFINEGKILGEQNVDNNLEQQYMSVMGEEY